MTTKPSRTPLTRALLTLLIIVTSVIALWQPLDDQASRSIDASLKRSLISFALARGLNGVISVAQGTEFAIQPAGVGVNFSPGEILDPINDLVERFSWVMLLSSTSLGIQQVLMDVSRWIWISLCLGILASLFILSFWWRVPFLIASQQLIGRLFVFILIMRFSVPLMALGNELMFQVFLNDRYEHAAKALEVARDDLGNINAENHQSSSQTELDDGLLGQAAQLYRQAIAQVNFEEKLASYQQSAESVSENTLHLIVVYLLQTMFFPLFFLWLITKSMREIFKR